MIRVRQATIRIYSGHTNSEGDFPFVEIVTDRELSVSYDDGTYWIGESGKGGECITISWKYENFREEDKD